MLQVLAAFGFLAAVRLTSTVIFQSFASQESEIAETCVSAATQNPRSWSLLRFWRRPSTQIDSMSALEQALPLSVSAGSSKTEQSPLLDEGIVMSQPKHHRNLSAPPAALSSLSQQERILHTSYGAELLAASNRNARLYRYPQRRRSHASFDERFARSCKESSMPFRFTTHDSFVDTPLASRPSFPSAQDFTDDRWNESNPKASLSIDDSSFAFPSRFRWTPSPKLGISRPASAGLIVHTTLPFPPEPMELDDLIGQVTDAMPKGAEGRLAKSQSSLKAHCPMASPSIARDVQVVHIDALDSETSSDDASQADSTHDEQVAKRLDEDAMEVEVESQEPPANERTGIIVGSTCDLGTVSMTEVDTLAERGTEKRRGRSMQPYDSTLPPTISTGRPALAVDLRPSSSWFDAFVVQCLGSSLLPFMLWRRQESSTRIHPTS